MDYFEAAVGDVAVVFLGGGYGDDAIPLSIASIGRFPSGCESQVGGCGALSVIQRDECHLADNGIFDV